MAQFEETGLGFCLVREGAIASWCLTVFAAGNARELGLMTMPRERGKGYATLVAAACVRECVGRGLVPHWHCEEENPASAAVAEKVGFLDPQRYRAFRVAL